MDNIVKEIKEWQGLDSVETVYKCIRKCANDMDEDYLDQNSNTIDDCKFASFLLHKHIISSENYHSLVKNSTCADYMLFGNYSDCNYSVFPSNVKGDEVLCMGYHLLAEFIHSSDSAKKLVFKSLTEWDADNSNIHVTLTDKDYTVDTESSNYLFGEQCKDGHSKSGYFKNVHSEWLWCTSHSVEDTIKLVTARKKI